MYQTLNGSYDDAYTDAQLKQIIIDINNDLIVNG